MNGTCIPNLKVMRQSVLKLTGESHSSCITTCGARLHSILEDIRIAINYGNLL